MQFHLWAHYRDTPLWLGFYDGGKKWQEILRRKEGLKTLQTPAPEYVKEAYAIAIPLPHDVEYHVARDRVVQHLAHVAELLKSRPVTCRADTRVRTCCRLRALAIRSGPATEGGCGICWNLLRGSRG